VAAGSILPQQAPRPEAPPSQDIPFPSTRRRTWQKYVWAAAVLVVVIAFYEFFVSSEERVIITRRADVAPAPAPAPQQDTSRAAPGATPGSERATTGGPAAKKAEAASVEQAPPVQPVVAALAPKPAPEPASKPATPASAAVTPPAPPKSGERQVTLLFEDESWVEIRDRDGKVILWQLNLPGTRQVVSGRPPLSFVIGNAHGVRLTYDDRAVDLAPYTRTDVARMTLE
jgi:cytoskeleton protein RodZ